MEQIRSTFATARINRLIGRSFSAASVLLTAESTLNFISQQPFLNKPLAWSIAIGMWLTTALYFGSFWFGSAKLIYLRIHALYMFIVVLSWPFILTKPIPTDGSFYPWIWWAVDTGWLACALSFRLRWVIAYFLGLNFIIQLTFSTPLGGSHSLVSLVTDYTFTLLTNGTAAVIALLLRNAAERTDRANAQAIQLAILQAKTEAEARERQRLDALVHDRVLTALISASLASNDVEAKAASDLANSAMSKLAEVAKSDQLGSVYTQDLLDAVAVAAKNLDPKIDCFQTDNGKWQVEREVATALTEATLQAIQNSILHAGAKASRELYLKSTDRSLKIVIKDDGKGFRPNRIPKGRLGLRVSVIGRVEAVGGEVHISSTPGAGATIVLEWSNR